jgi:hypothetical protein
MSVERVNETINEAQFTAIKFLVYFFVFLVALLGIVFGGAIMLVCQGCGVMRQIVALLAAIMAQVQGKQHQHGQTEPQSEEQTRRAWEFAEKYGLYQPFGK